MKELIRKYMERISDLEKAQNINYKTVKEELNSLPDYSAQLAEAVAKGSQTDYEKLRRKDEYVVHRRIYLEQQLDGFCNEEKIIPEEELNKMIETVREEFKTRSKKHIDIIFHNIESSIQEDEAWFQEGISTNWFINYALERGRGNMAEMEDQEWQNLRNRHLVPGGGVGLKEAVRQTPSLNSFMNNCRKKQREETGE